MDRYLGILKKMGVEATLSTLGARLCKGVYQAARKHSCPYMIEPQTPLNGAILAGGQCAGLIGFFSEPGLDQLISRCRFALINVSNSHGPRTDMGNVLSEDRAVGALAANFFLQRGNGHFLVLEQADRTFSRERAEGFSDALAKAGKKTQSLSVSGEISGKLWSPANYIASVWEQLRPTLTDLPPRTAIFAVSDWIGWPVLQILERYLPDRKATTSLLGVDNLHDGFYDPRRSGGLSSIVPDFHRCGHRALEWMLENLNTPEMLPGKVQRIPPGGLIERASTAGPACEDPLTAQMMRTIWTGIRNEDPIDLASIARKSGMSVRTMELKFKNHLGQRARDFIAEQRVAYGKHLLQDKNHSIAEVSERCGYSEIAAFSRNFKRLTQFSPRAWRENHQAAGNSY